MKLEKLHRITRRKIAGEIELFNLNSREIGWLEVLRGWLREGWVFFILSRIFPSRILMKVSLTTMEDYSLLMFHHWILFPWLKISRFPKPDVKCNVLCFSRHRSIIRSSLPSLQRKSSFLPEETRLIKLRMKQEERVSATCKRSDSSTGLVIRTMFAETWIFTQRFLPKTGAHSNSKKDTYADDSLFDCPRSPPFFHYSSFSARYRSTFFSIFLSFSLFLLNFSERTHSSVDSI